MPESAEIRVISESLNKLYAGQVLTKIEIGSRSRYKNGLPDHDKLPLPQKLEYVTARGKKVLFILENSALIFSLGMEGKFKMSPGNHSDLWLHLDSILYFDDSRHFGSLEIVINRNELPIRLSKLGLDLLGQRDQVTAERWLTRCRLKKWNNKPIADVLLDQEFFSGIGNYLRAEILYAARINPFRLISELTDEQLESVRQFALVIIDESYRSQGATIYTFENVGGEKGTFQMKVYNRTTDPEGNPVQRDKMKGDRVIHWVPAVQI